MIENKYVEQEINIGYNASHVVIQHYDIFDSTIQLSLKSIDVVLG